VAAEVGERFVIVSFPLFGQRCSQAIPSFMRLIAILLLTVTTIFCRSAVESQWSRNSRSAH
jgi:hypothetical protein